MPAFRRAQLSGRGVSYWTDGKGDERILYVTTGYRLVALNARNGEMISGFGSDGAVDLKAGAVKGRGDPINLEDGEIGLHATPAIVRDVAIVGSSFPEGATVETHNNTKGLVRAFDVRTGKLLWTFNTIPRPGEFGNDTWENESWAVNGNVAVWTQITVDEELGLVYLPVEDAGPLPARGARLQQRPRPHAGGGDRRQRRQRRPDHDRRLGRRRFVVDWVGTTVPRHPPQREHALHAREQRRLRPDQGPVLGVGRPGLHREEG